MIEPAAPPPSPPSAETLARLRAGFADVAPGSGPTTADADQIWAAVHGPVDGVPEPDREALIDRLHEDPQLALEWRLAAALGPIEADDLPDLAEPAIPSNQDVSWPRGATVSTAVGVAVAAAAALVLWIAAPKPTPPPSSEPAALRTPQGHSPLSTALRADAPLPRTDFRLNWSSDVESASAFSVRVTTQDLEPIFEAHDLSATTVRVPTTALESVASGTVLLWRVEAIGPAGRRHASEVWELTVE